MIFGYHLFFDVHNNILLHALVIARNAATRKTRLFGTCTFITVCAQPRPQHALRLGH